MIERVIVCARCHSDQVTYTTLHMGLSCSVCDYKARFSYSDSGECGAYINGRPRVNLDSLLLPKGFIYANDFVAARATIGYGKTWKEFCHEGLNKAGHVIGVRMAYPNEGEIKIWLLGDLLTNGCWEGQGSNYTSIGQDDIVVFYRRFAYH